MKRPILALSLGLILGAAGYLFADSFAEVKARDAKISRLKVYQTAVFDGVVTASSGVVGNVTGNVTGNVSGGTSILGPVPAAQTIAAAATITADACGGIKRIASASAVTTGTTNTFTAPAAGNAGCRMIVMNTNAADAITLDANALFQAQDGANVALAAGGTVEVASTGAVWIQVAAAIEPNA